MKKRAIVFCMLAGLMWGASGVFSNLLSPYGFSPLQLTATRGIVSGIAICIYVFFYNRRLFRVTPKQFMLHAAAGVTVFCTASLYYISMRTSSVSTAAVLMNTSPAFVMAFSVAFFREKLTWKKFIGLVVILASGVLTGMRFQIWGILTGIASGLCYSIYSIIAKQEARRGYDTLTATLYHFTVMGFVGLAFLNIPAYAVSVAKEPMVTIPLLIGIGLFTCVIPYFLFSLSLNYVPVGTAAALGIVEPMAATVYSVVFFQEKLTAAGVVGIVMVLSACLIFASIKEEA